SPSPRAAGGGRGAGVRQSRRRRPDAYPCAGRLAPPSARSRGRSLARPALSLSASPTANSSSRPPPPLVISGGRREEVARLVASLPGSWRRRWQQACNPRDFIASAPQRPRRARLRRVAAAHLRKIRSRRSAPFLSAPCLEGDMVWQATDGRFAGLVGDWRMRPPRPGARRAAAAGPAPALPVARASGGHGIGTRRRTIRVRGQRGAGRPRRWFCCPCRHRCRGTLPSARRRRAARGASSSLCWISCEIYLINIFLLPGSTEMLMNSSYSPTMNASL
ncbi:unnamed protein product, partial [Urochloa humidicola]